MLAHWNAPPLWELSLEVLEFQCLCPVVRIGSSLHLENLEYLIDFTVADEQSSPLGHLCKDAANAPYVNWSRVFFATK